MENGNKERTYKITSDWHMHTEHSCDEACMKTSDLPAEQRANGITDFGVTDHLHTHLQDADIARSRKAYDEVLAAHPELRGRFHFGVEASVMSEWEADRIARGDYVGSPIYGIREGCPKNARPWIGADAGFCEKYGVEYVVTGVHWPLYVGHDAGYVVGEYFRQYLFAAAFPQTDILAHFLWWNPLVGDVEANPFFDFPAVVSEKMRGELQAALLENNVAFELNLGAVILPYPESFRDSYLGWCADLQNAGVTLSVGSDNHDLHADGRVYREAEEHFRHYGIDAGKFFCL